MSSDSIFLDSYGSEVWQSIALVWGLPSQIQIQPPHPPAPSPPEGGEGEKKSQDSTRRVISRETTFLSLDLLLVLRFVFFVKLRMLARQIHLPTLDVGPNNLSWRF